MEYWIAGQEVKVALLLTGGSLCMFLIAKCIYGSWLSGCIGGLTVLGVVLYAFWAAGPEDHVSGLEFVGLLGIMCVGTLLATIFGSKRKESSSANSPEALGGKG